ncbi:lipase family protein, partial [Pseudomonas marginalis]
MTMEEWKHPFFDESMPACALHGGWLSFCLVDESGDGKAYGGLRYEVVDSAGQRYKGHLNGEGFARLEGQCRGPVVLVLDAPYEAGRGYYSTLQQRDSYPLPITDLQVRAEQTRFSSVDGRRTESNPGRQSSDRFYQVEVSDLVRHIAHLPPVEKTPHR